MSTNHCVHQWILQQGVSLLKLNIFMYSLTNLKNTDIQQECLICARTLRATSDWIERNLSTAANRGKSLEKTDRNQYIPQGKGKASPVFLGFIFQHCLKPLQLPLFSASITANSQRCLRSPSQKSINSKQHTVIKPMHAFNRSNYYWVTGNSTLQTFH